MIRSLAVHTHQRPLFGEPFEPGQRGGFRYPPVVRFFQQHPAGKLVLHLGKEHILVRRAPALDNGGGQKRKNMGGVQIKRLHQGKHGMEIIVCNHQVPARDDTVLQIIGRNMRVRFHQRRVFQASQDGDYRHHAARIDGKTDDGTAHLVPVDLAGATEQLVEQEVELFITPFMRSKAKTVNFGIIYGISDFGLGRQLGVPRSEAAQYIDSYFARYTGVKEYMEGEKKKAREMGYVETLFGRRRYLPDIHAKNFNRRSFAERTAINTPIQGTAADIIKIAMLHVAKELKEAGVKSRVLLQVHDELVLEVVEEEKDKVSAIVKNAMERAVTLKVPLVADIAFGKTWADAK